jgi:hypothetical protein
VGQKLFATSNGVKSVVGDKFIFLTFGYSLFTNALKSHMLCETLIRILRGKKFMSYVSICNNFVDNLYYI